MSDGNYLSQSTTGDRSATDEYVAKTREDVIKELSSEGESHFSDRDIAIKTIQALIATNDEIFNRCKVHMKIPNEYKGRKSLSKIAPTFVKNDYNVVKIWNMLGMTQIAVFKEVAERSFSVRFMIELPERLEIFKVHTVHTKELGWSDIIDFNFILRSSLLLHDDILLPYLDKLRNHLEHIQLCLGEIDTWLMSPKNNATFLENAFGLDLNAIKITTSQSTWCRCGDHQYYEVCGNCGYSFVYHSPNYDSSRKCPRPRGGSTLFCCKKDFRILAEYNLNEKHEASFDVNNEDGRDQLRWMTEYLIFRYQTSIGSIIKRNDTDELERNGSDESPFKKRLKNA
jgi:hypothetical protein